MLAAILMLPLLAGAHVGLVAVHARLQTRILREHSGGGRFVVAKTAFATVRRPLMAAWAPSAFASSDCLPPTPTSAIFLRAPPLLIRK